MVTRTNTVQCPEMNVLPQEDQWNRGADVGNLFFFFISDSQRNTEVMQPLEAIESMTYTNECWCKIEMIGGKIDVPAYITDLWCSKSVYPYQWWLCSR